MSSAAAATAAPDEQPRPVRFGIMGCASIARKLARAMLLAAPAAAVAAVGSRSEGMVFRKSHKTWHYENGPRYQWSTTSIHSRDVLLEKPTALCAADLDAILASCEENGVQFMDSTMWMHHPRTAKMRELLDDRSTIGNVRLVSSSD
jgi:predicted dehydrogenase